jgi:hypothetical protein
MIFKTENWKTTVIGVCQLVNGLYPVIEAFSHDHPTFIDPKLVVTFLLINSILQFLKGALAKDASKGSDRPQEVADAKLSNGPPFIEEKKENL